MLEHLIAARRPLQREAMGRHKGGIKLVLRHVIQQPMHIALAVLLRGADRQAFVDHQPQRAFVHHAVYPQNRDIAAFAASVKRLTQRGADVGFQMQQLFGFIINLAEPFAARLHADSVDTAVRAAPIT